MTFWASQNEMQLSLFCLSVSPMIFSGFFTLFCSADILADCRQESSSYRQFVPESLQPKLESIISVIFLGNFAMEFPPTTGLQQWLLDSRDLSHYKAGNDDVRLVRRSWSMARYSGFIL